jgi:2-iminobutanoate/2-iminopropanoate deaminase
MNKKVVSTNTAPAAIGPYSQAIISNGFLFVSGQIPIIPESGAIAEGIDAQAQQVLKNLSAILASVGVTTENVVKTTIFLKNMDDFATVNTIYGSYFPNNPPARSTVQVAKLPKDVLIEIEAIATIA